MLRFFYVTMLQRWSWRGAIEKASATWLSAMERLFTLELIHTRKVHLLIIRIKELKMLGLLDIEVIKIGIYLGQLFGWVDTCCGAIPQAWRRTSSNSEGSSCPRHHQIPSAHLVEEWMDKGLHNSHCALDWTLACTCCLVVRVRTWYLPRIYSRTCVCTSIHKGSYWWS